MQHQAICLAVAVGGASVIPKPTLAGGLPISGKAGPTQQTLAAAESGSGITLNQRRQHMTITRCFCALIALLTGSQSPATNYRTEDRYNPQHIDRLPPEVRNSILHKCVEPKALHFFASYFGDSTRIVLHFEHFVCDGDGTYCNTSGCLHQVWTSIGGHYRLLRSYYAPAGD